MRVRIHRGTQEIGGTCIELESQGERILLDLGLPLDGNPDDASIHPSIEGLDGKGSLRALVLSHGHPDHWGLAHLAGPDLQVALGAATYRIFEAAQPFLPRSYVPHHPILFSDGKPFVIGPFRITPHLVDHSAYDAYAFEVEANGKRLFYSGDLRGHGRKAALFERLIARPPRGIDVLLMEGSTLGRLDADQRFPTENDIEANLADIFRSSTGMALVAASAQNIDRMVSLYRACKRTGRTLVIDLYAAEILRATGNDNIPQSHWPHVAVYIPRYQRLRIKQSERFELLDPHRKNRIFDDGLRAIARDAAILFRAPMLPDLERVGCLADAVAIWSQWDGYLAQKKGRDIADALAARGIRIEHAHTSGHASIADLKRLVDAIAPRMLVPIHTFEPQRFPDYFGSAVVLKDDSHSWEISA